MIEIRVQARDKRAAALYRYMHWFTRYHRRQIEPAIERAVIDSILYGREVGLAGAVARFKRAVPILRPSRAR